MDSRNLNTEAFLASLPVATGYLAVGFTFGAIFSGRFINHNVSAVAISILSFAGSAQLTLIQLLSNNEHVFSIFFTLLILNIRHLIYGTVISQFGLTKSNALLAFLITDETYGVLVQKPSFSKSFRGTLLFCLLSWSYWIFGTVLGTIFAGHISKEFLKVLEGGLPLMFTALAVNMVMKIKDISLLLWALPIVGISYYFGVGVGALFGAPLIVVLQKMVLKK